MKRKKKPTSSNPFHQTKPEPDLPVFPMRLNKFIAKSGICSRRKAAELVKSGAITVNGKVEKEPFVMVQETDEVIYDGQILEVETRFIYLLLNKPKGVITTTSDEHGRKTVLDLLRSPGRERLFPVGRLDRDTTGLLLITNDGDLAKKLAHPSHQTRKEYLVTLDRSLAKHDYEAILAGLELPDGLAPVKDLRYADAEDRNRVIITIFIGRNRIVRRIFEFCGYTVKRLDRIYLAGLTKKNLPRGKHRHLTAREVIMLKHFT